MWGNRLGWIISAGIALLMGLAIWKLVSPPGMTPPIHSSIFQVGLKPIALPDSPDTVVSAGTSDEDAGKIYRDIIEELQKNGAKYEKFLSEKTPVVTDALLHPVGLLKSARACKNCNIFAGAPAELVNYKNEQPGLEALTHFASRCADLGMVCFTKGDHNGAHEIWDAVFRLGVHLYNERLISRELEDGHALMSTGANCLKLYYDKENDPRNTAAAKFLASEEAYQKKLANAYHLLTVRGDETYAVKAEGRVVGQYVGDVFEIAESKEADPMFRVEAILHIGCYKFNVYKENEGSYGDQVGARRLLRIMSADTTLPPSVKAAAEAAKNLTLEDYHKVGGLSSDSLPGGH